MPIYEYRCAVCGHELEALQKFSDAPLVACPACARESLVKLVSAAGFQLKGSGWYATDFKGSGGKPAAKKADGGDAKPAATTTESKAESAAPAAAASPTAAAGTGTGTGPTSS